jgi:uncharacterized coiled-coil protein SlyX
MRVLLTYENFDAFGGTETYLLTVAQQLERLGHDASIYTANAGAVAEFARAEGVRVLRRAELPRDCDAVFAHDAATGFGLAHCYPDAARVFVAHSRDFALQGVPQLRDVSDAVVVLNDRVRSWVEAQAAHPPLTRLRQPIDVGRFLPRSTRARPRRVLVSSNYVSGRRAVQIERACRACGLEVDWIGATSRHTSRPERALADADIVIGLGRSVLEGMAAGRAAYVYGVMGGDGWVTPESYPTLEADGFAGLSSGRAIDTSRLAADLREWHPDMGEANRDLACAHHAVREHVIELVSLARRLLHGSAEVESGPPSGPSPVDELARLVRLEWQMYGRAAGAVFEAEQLRSERDRYGEDAEKAIARVTELDRHLHDARARIVEHEARATELERHLHDTHARIAKLDARIEEHEQVARQAQQQLRELVATRRYRLARSIAAPLDWARAHRRST